MATAEYWADTPIDRRETPLSRWLPTLDAIIAPEDPVRLVDEVLQATDWSEWEAAYLRKKGQPPVHPKPIAETPFGIIKSIMGLRQFLLRGLDKVKTEWLWTITAFNLMKLVRAIGEMRAEFAELIATA